MWNGTLFTHKCIVLNYLSYKPLWNSVRDSGGRREGGIHEGANRKVNSFSPPRSHVSGSECDRKGLWFPPPGYNLHPESSILICPRPCFSTCLWATKFFIPWVTSRLGFYPGLLSHDVSSYSLALTFAPILESDLGSHQFLLLAVLRLTSQVRISLGLVI